MNLMYARSISPDCTFSSVLLVCAMCLAKAWNSTFQNESLCATIARMKQQTRRDKKIYKTQKDVNQFHTNI
jgi:hypothetical protein